MIRSMEGFTFASVLDFNMGYITSNLMLMLMLMLKKYIPLYSHGIWENTNTNAYPWVSRLP
jgi:hypothetical protein